MAMTQRQHTNISDGALASKTTRLANDAKIAYALFTGIVKNKIAYPVREYCKNAWEVTPPGKPFLVDLPNRWSPKFRVRDYGPGLSHHFMMHRFPRLGDSTKDGNGVGGVSGWGFGAKSALAYLMEDLMSGSFSVISYREGIAAHYIISLSASGMPEVKHFMDVPTDEDDGLEVSFAVREDDFYAFEESAREILWSFEPRPVVTPDLGFDEPRVTGKGTGWISFNSSTVPFSGPQVRVGPVMYPIDMSEIRDSIGFLQPDDCIIFDVESDSVSPTASREQLQYTSGTKKALAAMITAYEQSFITEIQAKVDNASCYFEACQTFRTETAHLGTNRYSGLRGRVFWNGQPLRAGIDAKVQHLSTGWSSFDRFSRQTLDPSTIGKPKVVVEHSPYASLDRFIALDLVGQNILWARVKKCELPGFMAMCALKEDDIVILDKAPIAKRASTQVGTRANQVRRRRTMTITPDPAHHYTIVRITEGVQTVDLAEGGLKLSKINMYHRNKKDGIDLGNGFTNLRDGTFEHLMESLVRRKIITEKLTILVDTGVDELSDDWSDFGDWIEMRLNDVIDLSKLTPIQEQDRSSDIRHEVRTHAAFIKDEAPQDLRDFKTMFMKVQAELNAQSDRVENENDKAFAVLMMIKPGLAFPTLPSGPSGSQRVNAEFERLMLKYPLFKLIAGSYESYRGDERAAKFRHYFSILANQK
ncbi:hypothetical protein [Methylobacterium sp. WL120]|uniref:hypothetical protein n=1 Tax=Methylobacterium sp. WL120 TaxID=2603887 RepID=UPI0011CAC507|nr:hypothetical protein [Methylobacterium sp. WL120]TXM69649.1 hypothetical protein FV229_04710 [Methylobacterium sp. WL120]